MSGKKILIVDDEPAIIQLAQLYLLKEGYSLDTATNGNQAVEKAIKYKPDVILLDIMLPELDGLEVCKRLRAINHPAAIVMVTAKDDDIDKIIGLEIGADDYLTKPFNPRELVARIKAILRRDERRKTMGTTVSIQVGGISIDPSSREIIVEGRKINVRAQEFDLLLILMQNKGKVLTRDQLLNLAWGFDYPGQTRTVDVHIAQLRKKLGLAGEAIETIPGIGYKLVV